VSRVPTGWTVSGDATKRKNPPGIHGSFRNCPQGLFLLAAATVPLTRIARLAYILSPVGCTFEAPRNHHCLCRCQFCHRLSPHCREFPVGSVRPKPWDERGFKVTFDHDDLLPRGKDEFSDTAELLRRLVSHPDFAAADSEAQIAAVGRILPDFSNASRQCRNSSFANMGMWHRLRLRRSPEPLFPHRVQQHLLQQRHVANYPATSSSMTLSCSITWFSTARRLTIGSQRARVRRCSSNGHESHQRKGGKGTLSVICSSRPASGLRNRI
jgi:hypothetical protein